MVLFRSFGHRGHGGFGLDCLLSDRCHSEQRELYVEAWRWGMINHEVFDQRLYEGQLWKEK